MSQKGPRITIVGLLLLIVCGCSTSTRSATPTTTQPAPGGFTSSLDLSLPDSPDWVPVQFAPKFIEGESVSKEEVWPKNHDAITVICQVDSGEQYLNPYNQTIESRWYGILIPQSDVDPQAMSKAENTPNQNFVGYIQAFWLKGTDTAASNAPACTKSQ